MTRKALVIVAAAVLAAAGLWLILRDDHAPRASTPRSAGEGVAVSADPGTRGTTAAPSLPARDPGSAPASAEQNPREYVVGDIRVRDHRSGDNKPLDIPPNVHPAESRMIPPSLTHDISQKVKAVMNECTATVPPEARGASPRLEGQLIVSIKDHTLTITKATMQLRDIVGAALDPTKECIETKSVGLQTPATEQPDLENYSIGITFAIL